MKLPALIATAYLGFAFSPVLAGESAFPRVGSTYTLIYGKKPEGYFWPAEAKIIGKGDAEWYLVEFQRAYEPTRLIRRSDPASAAAPQATAIPTPTPSAVTERRWINFAWLAGAEEKR